MTTDFFKEFPSLWDGFVLLLKQHYMKWIMTEYLPGKKPVGNAVSGLYYSLGRSYWHFAQGQGTSWTKRFEERFFEYKYYPMKKLFTDYRELDALVEQSIAQLGIPAERCLLPALSFLRKEREDRFFRKTLKPHLDKRRQEILCSLEALEQELSQPVYYTLNVPVEGKNQKLRLGFASRCKKSKMGMESMDGYTYQFNGRTYRDNTSLWEKTVEELSGNVFLGKDCYGEGVLECYTPIPTFDSGDREWDSRLLEYLFFDGKDIRMVVLHGGYRIASLTFYGHLLCADARLKPIFEKLGWPLSLIRWEDE